MIQPENIQMIAYADPAYTATVLHVAQTMHTQPVISTSHTGMAANARSYYASTSHLRSGLGFGSWQLMTCLVIAVITATLLGLDFIKLRRTILVKNQAV